MDLQPVKDYLKARDALRENHHVVALKHLRASLGATKATPLLEHTLADAVDPDTAMGEAVLRLVTHDANRRTR